MFEPNGWTADFPTNTKILKKYFESSPYAQIWRLSNGQFAVKKLTTGVYWFCRTYQEAVGIRRMIAERCSKLNI